VIAFIVQASANLPRLLPSSQYQKDSVEKTIIRNPKTELTKTSMQLGMLLSKNL